MSRVCIISYFSFSLYPLGIFDEILFYQLPLFSINAYWETIQSRFLVNISFLSSFLVVNSSILPFEISDHYPIILAMDMHCPLGPLPFKYNHIWSDYQVARNIIQHTWGQHIEGSPGFIWENKLRNVQKALKNWAKTQYN